MMINFKDYLVGFGFILLLVIFLIQKIRTHYQKKKKIREKRIKRKDRRK
jgi:lipoprotein signal peptidase